MLRYNISIVRSVIAMKKGETGRFDNHADDEGPSDKSTGHDRLSNQTPAYPRVD